VHHSRAESIKRESTQHAHQTILPFLPEEAAHDRSEREEHVSAVQTVRPSQPDGTEGLIVRSKTLTNRPENDNRISSGKRRTCPCYPKAGIAHSVPQTETTWMQNISIRG
jgi:hypothetical protein